jgi:outer membrane lipoprotein SlyB
MKKLLIVIILLVFAGCASYRPIVDLKTSPGKTYSTYETDLKECQQYAKQVSPGASAATGAGVGAGIGGLLGGITTAIVGGDVGKGLALGASVGAISGGTSGAGHGVQSQVDIIRKCMQARGYTVLH